MFSSIGTKAVFHNRKFTIMGPVRVIIMCIVLIEVHLFIIISAGCFFLLITILLIINFGFINIVVYCFRNIALTLVIIENKLYQFIYIVIAEFCKLCSLIWNSSRYFGVFMYSFL